MIAWKAPASPPKARELSKGHTCSMTFLVKKGASTLLAAFSAANADARAKASESTRRRDNGVHNCTRAGRPFSARGSKSMRLERAVKKQREDATRHTRINAKKQRGTVHCGQDGLISDAGA